jgi:hypothetical protein
MKQYRLVITPLTRAAFVAYYVLLDEKVDKLPDDDKLWVTATTIKKVLRKVKKITPKDGQVMYTYLNRKPIS